MRPLHGLARGRPASSPQYATKVTAFMPGMCASLLRHVADARADFERRRGDIEAEHGMRPLVGATKPSSALIIVLLPAPLGPSRPTAPARERRRDIAQRRASSVGDGDALQRDDLRGWRLGHLE